MPRQAPTLLLITASAPEIQWVRRSRVLNFQQITMPYQRVNRRFYSCRSICKRLSRSRIQLHWTLPLNLAYAFAQRYRR
jgi:hypothetical protein